MQGISNPASPMNANGHFSDFETLPLLICVLSSYRRESKAISTGSLNPSQAIETKIEIGKQRRTGKSKLQSASVDFTCTGIVPYRYLSFGFTRWQSFRSVTTRAKNCELKTLSYSISIS